MKPDYIFEVSWEVCNKVGGIYTVLSTKARQLTERFGDRYILLGPDVWKETDENPDFIEDKTLMPAWQERAASEGLHFHLGRWNVTGHPIVIQVDFTTFFTSKNKIFAKFWETYKLDSLSGGWDYIEPALFGYAAARIIESYYEFHLSGQDKIIAHFHEWMTGTGILYLNEFMPQAATVFTTHATTLGRSVAGNGLPLYKNLTTYDPEATAQNFNMKSKFSLEYHSANTCDVFTTVSPVTAMECSHFLRRDVNVVTPNGFENSFVPEGSDFLVKREEARSRVRKVAEALLNQPLPEDSLWILTSGRYEFRNKGIDLFIDSLGRLNRDPDTKRPILAVIAMPGNQKGPDEAMLQRMPNPDFNQPITGVYLTHLLWDPSNDAVLRRIQENGLFNRPEDKVKIIFIPSYLNGRDGVFNLTYYDFVIGFDVSTFASYYEPWGYTPLESLAFHVPAMITSLSGFGQWIRNHDPETEPGLVILERDDENDRAVVDQMITNIKKALDWDTAEFESARNQAFQLSQLVLWDKLISYYLEAYEIALKKSLTRSDQYLSKQVVDISALLQQVTIVKPEWRKILVSPTLPEKFHMLTELAWNLWWTWNSDAISLFEEIDPELWKESRQNPLSLIEAITIDKIHYLEQNPKFMAKLQTVYQRFRGYMDVERNGKDDLVAYFSMEYGLHDSLKMYSGGLGVLAGDYIKEASDSNANMVAVGLIYRYGYFTQVISLFGDQVARYEALKFSHLPLTPARSSEGEWIRVSVALPGRVVYAKVWILQVGRISLYLMDADIPENSEADRSISFNLYGGDEEMRFKQELLLGVGGIRLLDVLGIHPDIYHINEGHGAFIGLERLRKYVQIEKLNFMEALEVVRSSTLFTTHTPVAAGHDHFTEDLLRTYIPHYADRLNITWDSFMNMGRMHKNRPEDKFSMSVLAVNFSQEVNGVSRLHGRVSQEMFSPLFDGYFANEIPVGYVTNGVHYPSWTAPAWRKLHEEAFGSEFLHDQSNPDHWKKIHGVPDAKIWEVRNQLRRELIEYLRDKVARDLTLRQENPKLIFQTIETLSEHTLTIGFARRFATYKRAHLLFSNLERLDGLINNPDYPIQFIFAGKAHPRDKAGQDLIKRIIDISKRPEFIGKIIFLENYEIGLSKKLIPGVDIWLNTPTRPMEASGTSGEKAVMNGVVNLSVLDGWWAEGYRPEAGFAIPEGRMYQDQHYQDELDAEILYNLLEDKIMPMFYRRNTENVPVEWIRYIKNTFSEIAPHYTMKRMLNDYQSKYYSKLFTRIKEVRKDDYHLARRVAKWKRKLVSNWDKIEVIDMKVPDLSISPLKLGEVFEAQVTLLIHEISCNDIGVEALFGQKDNGEVNNILWVKEMEAKKLEDNRVLYSCSFQLDRAGGYDYIFRIYPKSDLVPHKQSLRLVKWI
ncbi:MAG TPA: alpha-glucan family phosphorylase [Bacteroidales bacterium]|nr:alpha-glucan family phosphorylase [Bacteroidales bacterium]